MEDMIEEYNKITKMIQNRKKESQNQRINCKSDSGEKITI